MNTQKIQSFQGLRGIAMILVFLAHGTMYYFWSRGKLWGSSGAVGVQIFIMLSGFLTYYHWNEKQTVKITDALRNKAKKIYLLHLITLLLSIPFYWRLFLDSWKTFFRSMILNILCLNTWIPKIHYYNAFNGVSWYLTVLFLWVIITPALMKIIRKIPQKCLIFVLLMIVLGEFILAATIPHTDITEWILYYNPLVRTLDFINGIVLCRYLEAYKDFTRRKKLCGGGGMLLLILISAIFVKASPIREYYYYSAVWALPVMLILAVLYLKENQSKAVKWTFQNSLLVWFGDISMEFFLIHMPVIRYLEVCYRRLNWDYNVFLYILGFILSVVAAALWKKFYQRCFLDRRFN